MVSHALSIIAIIVLFSACLIPMKSLAYDTYWGYYVCYDQDTRGRVGSCQLSTAVCDSKYLHYYGQYNDRDEWGEGLLRCHNERKSVIDPVARTWLK